MTGVQTCALPISFMEIPPLYKKTLNGVSLVSTSSSSTPKKSMADLKRDFETITSNKKLFEQIGKNAGEKH